MRLVALFTLVGCLAAVEGQSVRSNPGFAAHSVPRNDDGSSDLEPIGFTINFFGKMRGTTYVNNNGNLTFDNALPTYTPFGLQKTAREIIAPFFADVDTRAPQSKLVTFGQDTVNGHKAFGANYISVGYFSQHVDKLNSFQVVLIDRTDTGAGNFDIEFNYSRIQWETGDASGGTNGYGGVPATVGWSNGTAEDGTSFELPGSMISGAFLDGGPNALVRQTLNEVVTNTSKAVPGRILFRARDGRISPGLSIDNATALPDAVMGSSYSTTLTASGEKGPFRWAWTPDVVAPPGLTLSANGVVSGVPTTTGTYSFTLRTTAATEDGDLTVYQRGSITIQAAQISIANVCPLQDATVGRPFSMNFRATGSSALVWSVEDLYSLPPGVGLSSNGLLAGTPAAAGTYTFNLRARSANSDGSQPERLPCRLNVMPAALRLASGCVLPNATTSVPYSQQLLADGGLGPYRYQLFGQIPQGMALTSDGYLAGTPSYASTYLFQVAVTDTRNQQTAQDCSLTVDSAAFSIASVCPLPVGVTGSAYSAKLPGSYTWSLAGTLPSGLALSPDGTIAGTPMVAGYTAFRLIATNTGGQQTGQSCTLSVTRGDLGIAGCPLPDASIGASYSVRLNPLGGSAPYFFVANGALPPGISITTDGVATGSATTAGSYSFNVMVREASGQTATQSCRLNVNPLPLQVSTTCPLPTAQVGQAYSASLAAAGGTSPYRFDVLGFLPAGLQNTADGTIKGTPNALGGQSFLVRVTDGQRNTADSVCSIEVVLPKVPAISIADPPAVVAPAVTNLAITVQLAQAYSQAVDGTVTMTIQPGTRSTEAAANQADPRLRFANGQTSANFTLPAGTTKIALPIVSTGTVASTVTLSLSNLRAAGAVLPVYPTVKTFTIAAAAPVVTSACYTRISTGIDVLVSGYSTTRELTHADITADTRSTQIDVKSAALAYFTAPDTVRAGGTFSLEIPYALPIDPSTPVGNVTLNLFNTVGASGSRTLQICP